MSATISVDVTVCDGIEQDAFEEWAASNGYDMHVHPLHWLFMNEKTDAARRGWKAGLTHAAERLASRLHAAHEMLRWAREALDSGYRSTRAKQEIAKIDEYFAGQANPPNPVDRGAAVVSALADEADRLRQALTNTRVALCGLQPALNVMARDVLSDIIADNIDAALRGPQ